MMIYNTHMLSFAQYFEQYIQEAVVPFTSYKLFFQVFRKQCDTMEKLVKKLTDTIIGNEEYIEETFGYELRNIIEGAKGLKEKFFDGKHYNSFTSNRESIDHSVKLLSTTDDEQFARNIISRYIPNDLKRIIDESLPNDKSWYYNYIIDDLNSWLAKAVDYGYEDKEIDFVQAIKDTTEEIDEQVKSWPHMYARYIAQSEWDHGQYNHSRKFRPKDLQEEEIAYHATVNVNELFEKGFNEIHDNDQNAGLGGGSHKGDISFSLDLSICQTIMIAFKHIWLIAHGEWTAQKVIDWVKLYSKDPKVDGKERQNKYDFPSIIRQYKMRRNAPFPPESPEDLVEFYLTALWFVNTPVDRNPVFWGTQGNEIIPKFKKVKYKDIGIIKAKIKTTNASEFLVAEREVRIPPADVVEMISIIR